MVDIDYLKNFLNLEDDIKEEINKKLSLYGATCIEDILITEEGSYVMFISNKDGLKLHVLTDSIYMSYMENGKYMIDDIHTNKNIPYSHHLAIKAYQKMKQNKLVSKPKIPRKHF